MSSSSTVTEVFEAEGEKDANPLSEDANLDVFGSNVEVHDFNMNFEDEMPIRDRACSWDLAMDQDGDGGQQAASVPMTPSAGMHAQHINTMNQINFSSQIKGGVYSQFTSGGDNEPSLFQDVDDAFMGVEVPGDPTNDKDSEDSYDISNGIMTRYNTYRQHNFNTRNSGNALDLSFGLHSLETKKKRKAKARTKSPKIAHAVAPEMSIPKKRGRKPGKISGTKHESRKFDAQMRPRIKGRFVSRKVYRDLYGSDAEGASGGEGGNDPNSMEASAADDGEESAAQAGDDSGDNNHAEESNAATDAEDGSTSAGSSATSSMVGDVGGINDKDFDGSSTSDKVSEDSGEEESSADVRTPTTVATTQ
jgi:hypothetical protein